MQPSSSGRPACSRSLACALFTLSRVRHGHSTPPFPNLRALCALAISACARHRFAFNHATACWQRRYALSCAPPALAP
eukprot:227731-Pleurochrysis_carterae.AAC.1